jgi:hypothetical protein
MCVVSIRNVHDCERLHCDINSVTKSVLKMVWLLMFVKAVLHILPSKLLVLTSIINSINSPTLGLQCVKELGVVSEYRLYFRRRIDYIFSKLKNVAFQITSSFTTADSPCVYCTTFLLHKLEYASIAWNAITSTFCGHTLLKL